MNNPDGIYFVSYAVVDWISAFVRRSYFEILIDSLNFCIDKKGMILHGYCLMTNHVHLIFRAGQGNPSDLLKDHKMFTSREMRKAIQTNIQESRKEWIIPRMREMGLANSNVQNYQFWQQHNQPIELDSNYLIDQKLNYIHNNPVEIGYVDNPKDWRYSSARDYAGTKGLVGVVLVG